MNLSRITFSVSGGDLLLHIRRKIEQVKVLVEEEQASMEAMRIEYEESKTLYLAEADRKYNDYVTQMRAWCEIPWWKRPWRGEQPAYVSKLSTYPHHSPSFYLPEYPDQLARLEQLRSFLKKNGHNVGYTITIKEAIDLGFNQGDAEDKNL